LSDGVYADKGNKRVRREGRREYRATHRHPRSPHEKVAEYERRKRRLRERRAENPDLVRRIEREKDARRRARLTMGANI